MGLPIWGLLKAINWTNAIGTGIQLATTASTIASQKKIESEEKTLHQLLNLNVARTEKLETELRKNEQEIRILQEKLLGLERKLMWVLIFAVMIIIILGITNVYLLLNPQ